MQFTEAQSGKRVTSIKPKGGSRLAKTAAVVAKEMENKGEGLMELP